MTKPEKITVTLHRRETNEPCICEVNLPAGFSRPALVRAIWIGEDHRGGALPDWSGAESLCPDGADWKVQNLRRDARLNGIPFTVKDQTEGIFVPGELDA